MGGMGALDGGVEGVMLSVTLSFIKPHVESPDTWCTECGYIGPQGFLDSD